LLNSKLLCNWLFSSFHIYCIFSVLVLFVSNSFFEMRTNNFYQIYIILAISFNRSQELNLVIWMLY
jgi:hypothetical protein